MATLQAEPLSDVIELRPEGRRPDPRAADSSAIDRPRPEAAARELLAALAVDLADESTRDTPRRLVDVYAEQLSPSPFNPTAFPNDGGYDELVVARAIPFRSLCEHHLLPSSASRTSATCPASASSGCRSSPASSITSPVRCRCGSA